MNLTSFNHSISTTTTARHQLTLVASRRRQLYHQSLHRPFNQTMMKCLMKLELSFGAKKDYWMTQSWYKNV